jgi:hypothetical protein
MSTLEIVYTIVFPILLMIIPIVLTCYRSEMDKNRILREKIIDKENENRQLQDI